MFGCVLGYPDKCGRTIFTWNGALKRPGHMVEIMMSNMFEKMILLELFYVLNNLAFKSKMIKKKYLL